MHPLTFEVGLTLEVLGNGFGDFGGIKLDGRNVKFSGNQSEFRAYRQSVTASFVALAGFYPVLSRNVSLGV